MVEGLLAGRQDSTCFNSNDSSWADKSPLSCLCPVEDINVVEESLLEKELQEQYAQPLEKAPQEPLTHSRPARWAATKLANQLLEQMT